jgi:hypothetical protein
MDRFGVNTGKHEREDNRRQYRHTGHGRWQPLLSGCPRPRFPDAPWLDYHLQLEGPDGDPDQRRLAGWFRHTDARPLDRIGRSRCGARTRTHCEISHRKTRRGTMGRSPLLYPRPARKAGQHSCIGWTRVPAIISRTYLGRQARAHTTCGPLALREEVETWTALRQSCSWPGARGAARRRPSGRCTPQLAGVHALAELAAGVLAQTYFRRLSHDSTLTPTSERIAAISLAT